MSIQFNCKPKGGRRCFKERGLRGLIEDLRCKAAVLSTVTEDINKGLLESLFR